MISQHDFLTKEECSQALNQIMSLKEYWINRAHNLYPFYTLGAASYLDTTKNDQSHYDEALKRYNPILESHFSLIYEKLIQKLTEIFEMVVLCDPHLALPGFHIFLANKFFENVTASVHFDFQFKPLKWNYQKIDYENPMSFTCAIDLPDSPAGLNYWNITTKDAQEAGYEDLEKLKN